jgi:hypothetical protein
MKEIAAHHRIRVPYQRAIFRNIGLLGPREQGFRDIATRIQVPGRQHPKSNILQLVHDWLQDERKGPWVIILESQGMNL